MHADGSKVLAQSISDEMDAIGRKNRGVKTNVVNGMDYFGIIRQTKAPAVLIEYGFIDNAADVANITSPTQQLAWAQATTKGICTTLGASYIPAGTGTLYRVQVGAFQNQAFARDYLRSIEAQGYQAFLVQPDDANRNYRVQMGAFASRENATAFCTEVRKTGLEAFVVVCEK